MREKKVIVIGAGFGGLAAGSYLLMNGYKTHILEKTNQSGGIAVTWKRKGYTFDGATNYLPGSATFLNIHAIISEILDFRKLSIYNYPEFIRIENNGETFRVYTDADRLREEMLRIAPEDKNTVDEFTTALKQFGRFNLPFEKAPEIFTPWDGISFLKNNLPLILFRQKWGTISIKKFAERFKNSSMRTMFKQIFPHHDHFAVMAPMVPLGWMHYKNAGYPRGGSATIGKLCEERYRSLGGTVEYNKPVEKILFKNSNAVGVVCENGERYDADIVVSSADMYHTFSKLLSEVQIPRRVEKRFRKAPAFSAIVQVSLGIGRLFDGEAEKSNLTLVKTIPMGNHHADDMMVRIFNFDNTFSPPGKTPVVVQLRTEDYAYWDTLRKDDPETYRERKEQVADVVIESLEKRFGAIKSKCEVVDVATPATYIRYNNLWKGAHQGWAPTPGIIGRPLKKTVTGLNNFYQTGQWISPAGGIPAVIAVGRQVAQIICKKDNKPFTVAGYE